jgi:heme/copper-type cytochrome/quinol oxidase subunit 2
MNYTVRVVEPDEYEDWLADQPRGTDQGVEVDEEEDTAGSGGRGDGDSSGDSQEGPTGEGGP